ncbi:hypothetical protein [Arthrobacter sp. STN4]|uniref:hypothetical protein n=1 Tax=Arthrobacter sp. STN4 TaxID=2923276 RepID=UPI00211A1971|nr:hypothetical protein [Arthrobacter sp. STN4]MCQ9164743.1 hypothetical protein [Arthrobacter sp. STN4]
MLVTALAGFVLTAVLVVLATAGTTWLVKVRPALEHDPDAHFWYLFAGLCVVLPAVLVAAVLNRWAGATLALLAAGTWWWTNTVVRRRLVQQANARALRLAEAERKALRARHAVVLARWGRYELDPASAIDFPGMADVRIPETSALVKALAQAQAEWVRRSPGPGGTARYRAAVTVLEGAFKAAELVSGRAGARSGSPSGQRTVEAVARHVPLGSS